MNPRDIMTRDVVSVASDTPMRKVAALLVEKRISGVPVVGGFKQSGIGREFGVFGLEAYLEPKAVLGAAA